MFLGGLGLISIGGQEYNEAEFVGQKRFNESNGACESLYDTERLGKIYLT
jgi:hypothetical protein